MILREKVVQKVDRVDIKKIQRKYTIWQIKSFNIQLVNNLSSQKMKMTYIEIFIT